MVFIPVFVAVAVTISFIYYFCSKSARISKLLDVAYVDIDGDKSPIRYVTETTNLLATGYAKYTKKGLPFSIPNLSDFNSPLVVLPLKYLDEVAYAPQSKLSLKEYFSKLGLLDYSYGPPIAEEVQHIARTDLNRALKNLIQPLQEVCAAAYKTDMPQCQDWTSIKPYSVMMCIFVRMGARMLVGPDLHDTWVALSFEYLPVFMKATKNVRTGYPASLRWITKYVDADVKAVIKLRRKGAELLRPVLESRLSELERGKEGAGQKHQDAIQWLIEEHKARQRKFSPDDLVQNLLVMTISSTHQTTMIALWVLFDLLDRPESLAEIKTEIGRVQGQNTEWTRQALGELKVMDSFMTETMRVHSFPQTTVNRMVMKPWTFKDGFKLPVGIQLSFPTQQYSLDADVHPNPDVFDPKRHLRKREEVDSAKYHFASTADSLAWGSGPHACPGRFLVQDVLKLIFIHMFTHYAFKYPKQGKVRPSPDAPNGIMTAPDVSMPVLFKEVV